jgi:hypothetical protein
MIVNALNSHLGGVEKTDRKTVGAGKSPPPSPAILSLLYGREAVSLPELADQLKQRPAEIHLSLKPLLLDGTVKCLYPVSLSMVPENLENPRLSRLVYYRMGPAPSIWKGSKQRRVSWTHLAKRPHLAAD